jgi:hypothetical protein
MEQNPHFTTVFRPAASDHLTADNSIESPFFLHHSIEAAAEGTLAVALKK